LKISTSNVYGGAVLSVSHGVVNDQVEIVLDNRSARLTSVITSASSKKLGLEPGKKVFAVFNATSVLIIADSEGVKFSARNQLDGTVASVKEGTVNAEVWVRLDCGESLAAIIAMDILKDLDIKAGSRVTALIKASHILLGVQE